MISWNTTTHVQEKNYSKMRTVERLDQIASNHYARTDDKKVLGGRKGWGEGIVVVGYFFTLVNIWSHTLNS